MVLTECDSAEVAGLESYGSTSSHSPQKCAVDFDDFLDSL